MNVDQERCTVAYLCISLYKIKLISFFLATLRDFSFSQSCGLGLVLVIHAQQCGFLVLGVMAMVMNIIQCSTFSIL